MKKSNGTGYGFRERFRYRFDNLMSKGLVVRILLLLIFSLFFVLLLGIIDLILEPGAGGPNPFWEALMHTFDPGNLDGSAESYGSRRIYIAILFIATLFGMFFTATLIGLINTGLESYMHSLRHGTSKVLERDHTVILGFNDITFAILGELAEANSNQKVMQKIVVMDEDTEKSEMEERIQLYLTENDQHRLALYTEEGKRDLFEPYARHTKVICRTGKIYEDNDLDMCSIADCRSIIICTGEDRQTIKAILACADIIRTIRTQREAEQDKALVPYMAAVIRDADNMDAARIAGGEDLEVLCYQDVMARIMANSSRHPGMSYVFTELFNYDKNEIYYVSREQILTEGTDFADEEGNSRTLDELGVYELNQYLKDAIVIGGTRGPLDYRLEKKELKSNRWEDVPSCLFPTMPPDTTIGDLDHLYIIEEDDNEYIETCSSVSRAAGVQETLDERSLLSKPDLILGVNSLVQPVLQELSGYLKEGTTIFVVDKEEKLTEDFRGGLAVDGLDVQPVSCNIDNYNTLFELMREERFRNLKSVLILSDETAGDAEMSPEERKDAADGLTLDRLLFMRKIRADLYPDLYITCEMNRDVNRKLAEKTGSEDYIVGSSVTAMIVTQIAQSRELHRVFHEILDEGGSEIYMSKAYKYLGNAGIPGNPQMPDTSVSLYALAAMVAAKNEVFIGYRKWNRDRKRYEIPVINPAKWNGARRVEEVFGAKDYVITIGDHN